MLQAGSAPLLDDEKAKMRGFFESAIGNSALNKFLGQSLFRRDPKTPSDVTKGEM